MLIETKEAIYKVERGDNSYLVERIGCLPIGLKNGLPEKISFEGDLMVFNSQGELVLFQGKKKVLKTAPIVLPEAVTMPQM